MNEGKFIQEALSFHREGDLGRAAGAYRSALSEDPENLTALHMLGVIERDAGNLVEARLLLAKAEDLSLDSAELSFDIALLLLRGAELKVAAQYFKKAVQLDPKLGPAWFYLGRLQRQQCEPEKAEHALLQAVDHLQASPSAVLELVRVELTLGKVAEAQSRLESLKDTKSEDAAYWSIWAQIYALSGRHDEAVTAVKNAIGLNADSVDYHFKLARLYIDQGLFEDAQDVYRTMAARWPDDYKIPMTQADLLFALGAYDKAWACYNSRHKRLGPYGRALETEVPQWNGEDVAGKRLILTMDQGLGEQVLFSRFIPELQECAEVLAVELDRRLLRLARRTFPDINFVPWTKPTHQDVLRQDADFHGAMGDFGRALRPSEKDFRKSPPVLQADAELVAQWREKVRAETGPEFVVGFSYASEKSPMAIEKSVALSCLTKLKSIKGVKFLNLQYGSCRQSLNQWAKEIGIEMLDFAETDPTRDLDEHAALIRATDLVVSVSTAVAHMSAALGHPTWVLLPPEEPSFLYWRSIDGQSIWYPTVQTIRPKVNETWDIVADRLSDAIDQASA